MKTFLEGEVLVTLKNGRIVKATWTFEYNIVRVNCHDTDFFDYESTESTKYSAANDALYCLKKNIIDKGGELA